MIGFEKLEELRTRKEVEDYLKQLGKKITDAEIDALKQSYDQAQESSGTLTLAQLDDVAGGGKCHLVTIENGNLKRLNTFDKQILQCPENIKLAFIFDKWLSEFNAFDDGNNVVIHRDKVQLFSLCKTDKGVAINSGDNTWHPSDGDDSSCRDVKIKFNFFDDSDVIVFADKLRSYQDKAIPIVDQGNLFIFQNNGTADKVLPHIKYLDMEANRLSDGESTTVDFEFSELKPLFDE